MNNKQKTIVSFVGGLVFFSAIVGVVLLKNERLRKEIEEQATILLETTRSIVSQIQIIVVKAGKIVNDNKIAKENSNNDEAPVALEADIYDAQWGIVESQNQEFVKSHLPR